MVSNRTRRFVQRRARFLCEYCHSSEQVSSDRFTIDHLVPQSLGGTDEPDNLALACTRCNQRRYNFTTGIDPVTQQEIPLFNPRNQKWADHFIWTADGLKILGITPTGRATCYRLDLNDELKYESFIQRSRKAWVEVGWHPPSEDPRQEQ
ncbi:HNH endonuclease signature motif containing protein [Allocoleopsis sp.]|uniref:HNH endonuclease n=1 Tax=Allocoleopsis sp. TaxID=3088169 RepID=UPI0032C21F42